ncbi:MAG TPA: glycerophosphodiester phosphodiesterase [Dehalococcoidia bacterium]|nr:glycerophosphodiester phosphodiesterase [Dehalococcoidia bacterium]
MNRVRSFALTAASVALLFIALGVLANLRSELGGDYESQLFYGRLYGDLLDDYRGIAVVAHNSGNRRTSINTAQTAGIPIIEIDVRTVNNRLYAAHSAPAPIVGHYFTQSVPLSVAWAQADDAPAIKLDLKDSSDTFLNELFSFLESRLSEEHGLIISSRSEYALARAREVLPQATLLLSVASWGRVDLVQTDPAISDTIDGITVSTTLLEEEEDVRLLKENGLLVYVWVVNHLGDLNRLVQWGVDGVTTDNLAIIELLAPDLVEDIEQAEQDLEDDEADASREGAVRPA